MNILPVSYTLNNGFQSKKCTKALSVATTFITAAAASVVPKDTLNEVFDDGQNKLNEKDAERALFNALNLINHLDLELLKEKNIQKYNNLKNLCDNAITKQQNNELTAADINGLINILLSTVFNS